MTAESLDLFGYATPDELRTLVESEHAALYFATPRAAGVPMVDASLTPAALDVLAQTCVELHETPGELMEGRAHTSRRSRRARSIGTCRARAAALPAGQLSGAPLRRGMRRSGRADSHAEGSSRHVESQLLTAAIQLGYIAEQLGHADVATTARHYARWAGGKAYRRALDVAPGEAPADHVARIEAIESRHHAAMDER